MTDTWTMVADTRADLAGHLEALRPEQRDAPTWCAEWKVRDVVAHLVGSADKMSMGKIMTGMLKHGFNANKMLAATAIEAGKRPPEELLEKLPQARTRRPRRGRCRPAELALSRTARTASRPQRVGVAGRRSSVIEIRSRPTVTAPV